MYIYKGKVPNLFFFLLIHLVLSPLSSFRLSFIHVISRLARRKEEGTDVVSSLSLFLFFSLCMSVMSIKRRERVRGVGCCIEAGGIGMIPLAHRLLMPPPSSMLYSLPTPLYALLRSVAHCIYTYIYKPARWWWWSNELQGGVVGDSWVEEGVGEGRRKRSDRWHHHSRKGEGSENRGSRDPSPVPCRPSQWEACE